MLQKIFSLILSIILLSSCEKKPLSFPLEVIIESPISETGKYPNSFINIFAPFDYNDDAFLVPKPIKFKRIDIGGRSIEIKPYSFENTGEPTFELYQNWLPIFFRDSIPPKELLIPKGDQDNISNWINKNIDKSIIVFLNNVNSSIAKRANIYICEDEASVLKKIQELLKDKPSTKLYLAILSENSKPFANNPTDSLIYGSTSENINLTESFHSIWEQAENYIQSTFNKIDHENEHPELFSIMAKAGLAAIRQGKSDDMVSHFDEIKNLKTPFFKKVYIGHEKRWNIIYHLVEEKDEIALNKIIEKLGKEIKNINSKLVDDFFEEDHHEQGEH